MTLIERINNIGQTWALVFPRMAKPSPEWIATWCGYTDESIEKGIVRASKKFGPGRPMPDPETVFRYIAGVARNEDEAALTARREHRNRGGANRPAPGTTTRKDNMTIESTHPIEQNIDEDAIANGETIMDQLGPDATHADLHQLVKAEDERIRKVVADLAAQQ